MEAGHWDEQELLEVLYGVRPEAGHPAACPACAAELERLRARRANLTAGPEIPEGWLAGQRSRIHRRMEEPGPARWRSTPAALGAAAALAVLGLVLLQPKRRPEPSVAQGGESRLYTEIYQQVVASSEPRAAVPIHALFEDQ